MGQAMKYYLYVSDAKVNMLYDQLPRGLGGWLRKINVSVGPVGGGIEGQMVRTRFERLNRVLRYLQKQGQIGTLDGPDAITDKPYIAGTALMQWGPMPLPKPTPHDQPERMEGIIFFGATTERVTLALGGSLHHVIGVPALHLEIPGPVSNMVPAGIAGLDGREQPAEAPAWLRGLLGGVVGRILGVPPVHQASAAKPELPAVLANPTSLNGLAAGLRLSDDNHSTAKRDTDWEETVLRSTKYAVEAGPMYPTTERVEFVAKVLVAGPDPARADDTRLVVLGSPLYVAKA